MSKKESEFDRYERMKKLERESELEKRKSLSGVKKKGGKPKPVVDDFGFKNWMKNYEMAIEEEYSDI